MSAQTATKTYDCKFPNCTNDATSPVGRYSYCSLHQSAAKPGKKAAADSVAGKLAGLQAQAKKVDKLRAKAERLTREALNAKRAADEEQEYFARELATLSQNGSSAS